ncbi:hypothetical protein [Pontimicrobium sp. MEBiC01747]
MLDDKILKEIYLNKEFVNSIKLIKLGFGEIQNINLDNDFYHLPLQILSSGIERFLKCYLCYGYYEKNNDFPDFNTLKSFAGSSGHDILELKKEIITNYFFLRHKDDSFLAEDKSFISDDKFLNELLNLLSEFGKFARYHNLDIVTSKRRPSIDVEKLWDEFETKILKNNSSLFKRFFNIKIQQSNETYDYINSEIISILERFIRGLSRQFTFVNLGSLAKQNSGWVFDFMKIKDKDLGRTIYKNISKEVKLRTRNPHKRTIEDDFERQSNPDFKYKNIKKVDFKGDWPFYADEIILESRNKHWYIITIDGHDYALNGNASDKYKLEHINNSGLVIFGKPTSIFIKIAEEL